MWDVIALVVMFVTLAFGRYGLPDGDRTGFWMLQLSAASIGIKGVIRLCHQWCRPAWLGLKASVRRCLQFCGLGPAIVLPAPDAVNAEQGAAPQSDSFANEQPNDSVSDELNLGSEDEISFGVLAGAGEGVSPRDE